MILKMHVWRWWAVCWSCFSPTKDHHTVFVGLVEVSGAGASPPTLNCRWVRWWAEVLWVTQEDSCYVQVPDRSCKLPGILQQRLQLPPGSWQTSRTLAAKIGEGCKLQLFLSRDIQAFPAAPEKFVDSQITSFRSGLHQWILRSLWTVIPHKLPTGQQKGADLHGTAYSRQMRSSRYNKYVNL